jgi:hypothetical protein
MINRTLRTRRIPVLAAAVTAALGGSILGGSASFGQTVVNWVGTPAVPSPYITATNWSSGVTPANVNNEFLSINNGGIATVSGTEAAEGAYLHLGLLTGESGQLQISGGTLTLGEFRIGGRERIVDINNPPNTIPNKGGSGTVIQTGGVVNVTFTSGAEPPIQSLYIADSGDATGNTAQGLYNISDGTLLSGIANNDAIVVGTGTGAQGTFIQSGGTVTSTGFLTVGRGGANSTYTMSGGTLQVGSTALAQSSNMTLRIGDGDYPTGTFAPTTGTFTMTNGTATARAEVTVGRNSGTGSVIVSGENTIFNSEHATVVGWGGTGTMTQGTVGGTGPTVNVAKVIVASQGLVVGRSSTSTLPGNGTYTLRSGTLGVGNGSGDHIAVGDGPFGTGTFNMEGGNVVLSDLLQLGRTNSPNDNRFNMGGGSLSAGRIVIGGGSGASNGRGTFTMTGGSVTASLANNIGWSGASTGTLDIQGGTYTLTNSATTGTDALLVVGNGGTGTLLLSGGTLSVQNPDVGVVDIGRSNGSGSFTLSGTGNLLANHLRMAERTAGTGTRTITFDGGTSTITTLTLGNIGNMTVNGGTHTVTTTNFGGGSFTANTNLTLPTSNVLGNGTINVGPAATLTLNTVNTPTEARTITKGGDGTLTVAGTQTHFAGTTLVVNAGTVNENSDPNGQNITSAATTNLNAAVSRIGTLSVTGGVTKQAAGTGNVINAGPVSIGATAKLDINNGKLITSSPVGSATGGVYNGTSGEIQRAYNGGAFTGPGGLTTSAVTPTTSIGVISAATKFGVAPADTAVFAGQTVTGASTLVMYTYGGDANLDGFVSGDDYSAIDFNIATPGANGWANGDFNYDGIISGDDYSVIDFNIVAQGTPFPTGGAGLSGVTAVPEPASLGLIGLAATALVGRRRRRDAQA